MRPKNRALHDSGCWGLFFGCGCGRDIQFGLHQVAAARGLCRPGYKLAKHGFTAWLLYLLGCISLVININLLTVVHSFIVILFLCSSVTLSIMWTTVTVDNAYSSQLPFTSSRDVLLPILERARVMAFSLEMHQFSISSLN